MGSKIIPGTRSREHVQHHSHAQLELPEKPLRHSRDPANEEFEPIEVAGYELMTCKGGLRRAHHEEVFKKLRDDPISAEAVYKIQKLLRDKGYYMLDEYQLVRTGKPDPRCGNKELLAAHKNSKLLAIGLQKRMVALGVGG
jgi:ribosomal protein S27AE